jgi:hypothetical protein
MRMAATFVGGDRPQSKCTLTKKSGYALCVPSAARFGWDADSCVKSRDQ